MNVSMRLTLDGLLQALRWRAHTVADELSVSRRKRRRAAKTRPLSPRQEDRRDDQRSR